MPDLKLQNMKVKSVTLDEEELTKILESFVKGFYFSDKDSPEFSFDFFEAHNEKHDDAVEVHCKITLLEPEDGNDNTPSI